MQVGKKWIFPREKSAPHRFQVLSLKVCRRCFHIMSELETGESNSDASHARWSAWWDSTKFSRRCISFFRIRDNNFSVLRPRFQIFAQQLCIVKRSGRAPNSPHHHKPGLIFPLWWNVRHMRERCHCHSKCTLWYATAERADIHSPYFISTAVNIVHVLCGLAQRGFIFT
jgi:hypothetical protein